MYDFFVKMDRTSLKSRYEIAKYVSDYTGFIMRTAFLSAAIALAHRIDPESGIHGPAFSVYFGKYVLLSFLYILSFTMFVSFIGVTQAIVWTVLDSVTPTGARIMRYKLIRWLVGTLSFLAAASFMIGLQASLPILINQLIAKA